jgi:Trypsin-co-occurring domain 1
VSEEQGKPAITRRKLMADYIQFTSADGNTLLVEVDEGEVSSQQGIQKAGLREMAGKSVAVAQTSFEHAIQQALQYNAQVFLQSVVNLPILPSEAEITFGLKITGEVGNVAVGKAGGETNYTIRLIWRRETKGTQLDEH